jgi:hypothetical protein
MKRCLPLLLLLAACASPPRAAYTLSASAEPGATPAKYVWVEEEDTRHGFVHTVLLYIPNRIFDILDIVRLRLRLGPGLAIDMRATEFADVFAGAYTSFFIGIPGPRGKPEINWPFGIESRAGAEVSVADGSAGGPYYGWLEFGMGFQFLLIGVDVGVDPWEVVDFACGILTFDPVHDDL